MSLTSRRTAMARKRYKPEEIVAKLRQVDVLVSQDQNRVDAIRQIGVSEVTYYGWLQEIAEVTLSSSTVWRGRRLCVRHVLCWPTFPLVSALRSTGSAAVTSTADCSAGCSALFAGFTATMAKSDFPRPCIIGYGSSPSRCGPGWHTACGQTQDIPGSNAIRLRVMWPSTPAGRQCLA